MSESEATSDQDDVSFIRTDDMVCLQCSEPGERVCLAAEGFGNRHCFLESIANKNYPPEMPSCVFVIEQALSVRALQEMVTAEAGDTRATTAPSGTTSGPGAQQADPTILANQEDGGGGDQEAAAGQQEPDSGTGATGNQLVVSQLISGGGGAKSESGVGGGGAGGLGGGNRTLLYGHAVLMRHLHSAMYLATLPICSSSDKLAFDVGLKHAKEIGESCWWTVHPGSKQRSEGEKVRVGDDLILVSVATERYLHYTTTDRPMTPPMASASANETAALNIMLAGKQAIVNASFHSTHWSIAPFGTGLSRMKNVGYVFGGQVLRLLHGGDECLTIAAQQTTAASDQQLMDLAPPSSGGGGGALDLGAGGGGGGGGGYQVGAAGNNNLMQLQQQVDVIYEGGAVVNQARSLWRLDLIRTRWSGGFVQYSNALRIRHITTGKYLGVNERLQLCLLAKIEATVERTAFCLKQTKDDSKGSKGSDGGDDKDEEVIGLPMIKYGESSFFIQHIDSQMWLSYRSYETKRRGIGRVEEKQAILSAEGKMDDCLEFSRSQEEEAKTARVIRKCDALFSKFIKILDHIQLVAMADQQQQQQQEQANQFNQFNEQGQAAQPQDQLQLQAQRQRSSISGGAGIKRRGSVAAGPIFHGPSSSSGVGAAAAIRPDEQQQQQQQFDSRRLDLQSIIQQQQFGGSLFPYESQVEMSKSLEDLIDYFAQPEEGCDHEQEQNRLRALRNRQDLFQEEGILNLILDAIDKINLISSQGLLVLLLSEESSSTWDSITGYFYQLLAAIIKDNHTNCAQFAQSHRLNWLFSRLSSQQASEGTGMLDVLHCVLVDSPEALNMLKESHIKVLISLLEKHGRDPKVLNVLCSLCVSNGVAIRSSQNTITNHLLPGRNLLLQTRLADEVASMRPNIYIARVDGSAMYHRWYYEVIVDHVELINGLSPHLRIGWANTKGYLPYPGGGFHWGANGVGDDFYSYGFDGQYLWTAGKPTLVRLPPNSTLTRQEQGTDGGAGHYGDYRNQQQALLESYAQQQNQFVTNQQQQQQQGTTATNSTDPNNLQQQQQGANLTALANIDSFTHSPYLRLQKNDVIGCLIDLSVPTIQFTINGKQIFGFFKNFNVMQGGFFHPVISFSAKVSCRFLFGSNQGELHYRPPSGFSPLVDVLLPNQDVCVEPCFSFGDLAKQTVSGPQITPDCVPQMVMDLVFIPKLIETNQIELTRQLESLRDSLAENMHEMWCMSRIEDGWIYGDEHDDQNQTHPYIAPFSMLPTLGKKYKLDLAAQTIKIILGLGYKITPTSSSHQTTINNNDNLQHHQTAGTNMQTGQRLKTYRLPNVPYMQSNGYKPAPLDLGPNSGELIGVKLNQLVELLAENIHNIWAAEKISLKWSYKRREPAPPPDQFGTFESQSFDNNQFGLFSSSGSGGGALADEVGRSCHLLAYKFVDDEIKLKNRQSALETVLTITAYGYHIEQASSWPAAGQLDQHPMASAGGGDTAPPGEPVAHGNLLSPTPSGAQSPLGVAGNRPSSGGGGGGGGGASPVSGTPTAINELHSHLQHQQQQQQQQQQQHLQLTGHENLLDNAPEVGLRHYRAEKTYAVQTGRWYYEVEINSLGHIQIGWANLSFHSNSVSLGCDENSWAFDCHTGRKVHASNYESFGQIGSIGDVIGCMLDLNDRTISYSLNGKLMLDYLGNEMAFAGSDLSSSSSSNSIGSSSAVEHANSFVPAISLGVNQRVRLCFGQDVEQLKYFTDFGLQEGYHPFCVNMHKPITLWYNKREANFVNLDELPQQQVNIEVTRLAPGNDSPPALKVAYKQFESQERANWEYLRLSLPVTVNCELIDEADKISKMQEIQAHQWRLAYTRQAAGGSFGPGGPGSGPGGLGAGGMGPGGGLFRGTQMEQAAFGLRHPARLEQHMLQSGFSLADVKDLQRSYQDQAARGAASGLATAAAAAATTTSGSRTATSRMQQQHQQQRKAFAKTQSVDQDDRGSAAAAPAPRPGGGPPSLAVPSFTEAQHRMLAAEGRQSPGALKRRRNTGVHLLRPGSLENIASDNELQQQQQISGDKSAASTTRPKSKFKSIFGSMRTRAPSEPPRSRSLIARPQQQHLGVPKISVQNEQQFGHNQDVASSSLSSRLSRPMSRSESSSSLAKPNESGGAGALVRRLSRVGAASLGLVGGASSSQQHSERASSASGQQQAAAAAQLTSSAAGASNAKLANESSLIGGNRGAMDLQQLDKQTLDLIDEYCYGVRIFPGQEPAHVLCGWVTSRFKHANLASLNDVQHTQVIQSTSLITGQAEICERRECYLLNAGQLYKEMHPSGSSASSPPAGGGGSNPTMLPSAGALGAALDLLHGAGGSSGHLATGGGATSGGGDGGGGGGGSGSPPAGSGPAQAVAAGQESASSRSNRGMLIGCHVDTSTGLLTFTVDGRQTRHRFLVEPQTKLYPAIFFQATTGDCLQFELSRAPLALPLSAAILSLTPKHVNPQCPPRLKVQTMQSCTWSRVPNTSLRPNSLKLSDARGWSMLADDPLAMLLVQVPEEDRCLDVLELIEHEKLLKFHSYTLILYGALCAQGNHKVAHIICSYVDQRQLLYAINSDYLSGDLRLGFADLLVALHLEFHAYGRYLTQNEFIVPITQQLCQLYSAAPQIAPATITSGSNLADSSPSAASTNNQDYFSHNQYFVSPLAHSFSQTECVSIRTEMSMSPINFDLSSHLAEGGANQLTAAAAATTTTTPQQQQQQQISTSLSASPAELGAAAAASAATTAARVKSLSTPYFPIDILKRLVFRALDEAVFKGNLPIRDLPGGSNENLFVPLLKLADKLLLIGCITNQDLNWLLSLIDPDTFSRPITTTTTTTSGSGKQQTTTAAAAAAAAAAIDSSYLLTGLSFLASPSSIWKPTILEQPKRLHHQHSSCSRGGGLLQMRKLDEHVKLIICHILHHLLDIQLRHRIESIMAFSVNFVGQLQLDQRRRYNDIKNSNLPSHLTARKTREFRCTPREQMRYILNFKNNNELDESNSSPSSETLRQTLKQLHSSMMKQIKVIIESSSSNDINASTLDASSDHSIGGAGETKLMQTDDYYARQRIMSSYGDQNFYNPNKHQNIGSPASNSINDNNNYSSGQRSALVTTFKKLLDVLRILKATLLSQDLQYDTQFAQFQAGSLAGQMVGQTELKFVKNIVKTIVKWAEESTIENKHLVRQMFHLLLRCYNGVGELIEALNNSYVIGEKSKQDVVELLRVLSKVRALLAVQMGPAEEEVMRDCLWTLVNNVVFFQHPDLIRILRVHENVMHVMMNTLSKRSRAQAGASSAAAAVQQDAGIQQQQQSQQPATLTNQQQQQQQQQSARQRAQSIPGLQQTDLLVDNQIAASANGANDNQEDDISKMVVSCCRFLCFFCRSSGKNQKAMFDHLGFLLENSNILLSRPSLRGSTPLDVAYSSLMENHELVLALRESYLEKIAIYLSRCGLQSNQELIDKGYTDVGWDPVEGERYLDFLRFCVWVNGESVEENSNLVIRLLIRRPECLGPALRGEGPGLFAAIKDAIAMADKIHAERQDVEREQQQQLTLSDRDQQQQQGGAGDADLELETGADGAQDEDEINMGSAILNFYCALVDLLGRCAPDLLTVGSQGKHESIRARSILRSLVPIQDLKNAISLRFALVSPQYAQVADNEMPFASIASSFMPNHKQSLVLFLERVYGIDDQATFFALLEEAFLPDMRAATMLERCPSPATATAPGANNSLRPDSYGTVATAGGDGGANQQQHQQQATDETLDEDSPENEMTLALNRYLGNSAIPLLIRESHYFKNAENYANLLEPTLHTVYRLSKVKILTKGQRESVSDFLIALTREMQPHQLLKLLRKLTVDVAVLNESTTVALRLLTLHYERCSKYYGYTGNAQTSASGVYGTATEEERRLTMVLFTNIFDSLSLMDYDPELFENALPCLNALACALPPDYSLTESRDGGVASNLGGSSQIGKPMGGAKSSTSQTSAAAAAAQAAATAAAAAGAQSVGPYVPQPVATQTIKLNADLRQLARRFSEHFHDAWASRKLDRDWTYGEQYNFKNKVHPRLKPYSLLSQHERERYIEPIEEAIKALIAMGWSIERHQQQQPSNTAHDSAGLAPSRSASRLDLHTSGSSGSSMGGGGDQLAEGTMSLATWREAIQNYNPQPIDTSNLSLSRELQNLVERSAENAHDLWAKRTMEDWEHRLRSTSCDILRAPIMLHPLMVPYDLLTDRERRKNRDRSQELLKYILFEGYRVYRQDDLINQSAAGAGGGQLSQQQRGRINSRAGAEPTLIESSARISASSRRRFAYSILDKLLAYTDTVMVKLELWKPSSNFSRRSSFKQSDRDVKFFSKVVLPLIERYFTAHREFFLNYYNLNQTTTPSGTGTEPSPTNTTIGGGGGQSSPTTDQQHQLTKQSQQLQPKGQGDVDATSGGGGPDVGTTSETFATSAPPGGVSSGGASGSTGFATIAEKEMLANLFCKLASVLRNKLSVIGPDAKIFVRCLQVLTRCLDARSLSEQAPDFIKTSMLNYFNKNAQDLSQCVYNLQMKRYNAVRGTTMRTSSSLYHVHLAILPILTALFDHLASSETGKHLLLDEIQLASQKIFQSLYILGTRIQLAGNHQFSRKELERHRHSYGNCQAAFAAAFPIAFLEPELIRFNRFSALNTRRQQQQQSINPTSAASAAAAAAAVGPGARGDRRQQQAAANAAAAAAAQVLQPVDNMPALPRLDELLQTVSKFVQTGRGLSSELAAGAMGPVLADGAARGAAVDRMLLQQHQQVGGAGQGPVGGGAGGAHAAGAAGQNQLGGGGARRRNQTVGQRMIPADNDAAIIEVILPLLCSYLPSWYVQGPEAPASGRNSGAGSGSTNVGVRHLNDLLRDIMLLIERQVGVESSGSGGGGVTQFNWMVAVAAHASQIIIDTPESGALSGSFLSLSTKVAQRAESIYHREELMRGYLKSTAEDTTAIEERIQEEFQVLVRDIYAFYPLLIKYVDFKKSVWLKPQLAAHHYRGAARGGENQQQQQQQQLLFGGDRGGSALDVSVSAPGRGGASAGGHHQLHDNYSNAGSSTSSSSSFGNQNLNQDADQDLAQGGGGAAAKPEQLLFHQVATVFDIWSNSQYFRREEQNFISLHEIDNMALIMQASNRPGRTFFQKSDPTKSSSAGRKKRRRSAGSGSEKRDREREVASSLLVVALKRLLPIGMNLFEGRERELVQHVKERFLKKEPQSKIEDLVRFQLTQPYKIDPSDEYCWQHYLYSRLGAQSSSAATGGGGGGELAAHHRSSVSNGRGQSLASEHQRLSTREDHHRSIISQGGGGANSSNGFTKRQVTFAADGADTSAPLVVDGRLVSRIVDMARVFHGLHIIDHPNLQQKAGRRSCVSTQRRRVVIACFRMTSLHSLPNHRAINIFLRSYCDTWLLDENLGQEKLIEDLTQTFEQAEMKSNGGDLGTIPRNDPLSQLIMTLSRQATTEHGSGSAASLSTGTMLMGDTTMTSGGGGGGNGGGSAGGVDKLYLQFAGIFRLSCGGGDDDEEDDEEAGDEENDNEGDGEKDEDSSGGSGGDRTAALADGQVNQHSEGSTGGGEHSNETQAGGGGGGDSGERNSNSSIHEQEIEKQRLLFQQSRLSNRGVAEMILLYISAFSRHQSPGSGSSGGSGAVGGSASGGSVGVGGASGAGSSQNLSEQTPMILSTLKLGISILRGGNVEVQRRMLKHLKDKRDVGFFTSIQMLLNSCSVLDLDAFERNQKAEALGVRSEGTASEKNMYDAEFTCKLFRFFQLLCEGHNLEFQNYLRTQTGNTTTVNVVISTVDYLLRLQESIMDFYWHYSSKDVIDASGTENFIKAITIAKQVFCTLTESIQGPCPQNQQALAHSRLWHAVGGFLFLFAHMQDKLSRNSSQLNLLIELLDLQKEMVIMMLSMLEGNVVNGTIGKQMVETLVESSANVEIILKFFDMFLKLPRLTSSTNFQEYDKNGSGWITLADLRRAMEQQKIYTPEETQYLLSCCEQNHDGMIDYREFIDRFHQPAKDIGFNLAVLLTNLAEHITNEPRLQRFLETASTVLNYFEPYLGRIEIMGSSKRIERVYFEVKESTLDQWAKPQIQESKRAFFYSIVTEGEGKEKLEAFVNFCEDTIFEMQHASNILGEDAQEPPTKADKYPFDAAGAAGGSGGGGGSGSGSASSTGGGGGSSGGGGSTSVGRHGGGGGSQSITGGGGGAASSRMDWSILAKDCFWYLIGLLLMVCQQLRPIRLRRRWLMIKRMSYLQLFLASWRLVFKLLFGSLKLTLTSLYSVSKFTFHIMTGDSTLINAIQTTDDGNDGGEAQTLRRAAGLKQQPYRSKLQDELGVAAGGQAQATTASATPNDGGGGNTSPIRVELVAAPSVMRASVVNVVTSGGSGQDQHQVARSSELGAGQAKTSTTGGSEQQQLASASAAAAAAATAPSSSGQHVVGGQSVTAVGDELGELGGIGDPASSLLLTSTPTSSRKARKSRGLAYKLTKLMSYNMKIISFLARNFYRIKLLALVTAFVINFILLFYKVTEWSNGNSAIGLGSAAESSFLFVARRTLGDGSLDGGASADSEGVRSIRSRLDEIEAKLQQSFAAYEMAHRRALGVDGDDDYNEHEVENDAGDTDVIDTVDDEDGDGGVEEKVAKRKKKKKKGRKTKKVEDELPSVGKLADGDDDENNNDGGDSKAAKAKTSLDRRVGSNGDNHRAGDDNKPAVAVGGRGEEDGDGGGGGNQHDDIHIDNDNDDDDDDDDDDEEEEGEGEETDLVEWVIMEEKYYYLQPILTFLATIHSVFSLCMLIAYYHLKVPLVIFKREKEIARKLEFDGLYITEEPDSENWWNGYWDRLVISAPSFPFNYWDKFVKKRVREKYREQYDYETLSKLLGMKRHGSSEPNQSSSLFKSGFFGQFGLAQSGLFKIDWRYQLWKAGVTLTDQSFQYQLLYLIFSVAGHFNSFFFAAHLLDVAVGFKKLQTILQSVTHNGKQLVLTVMLLTIVVYIYTVIAFNFFRKFYVQGDESAERKCHSMMTCFVYHLYQGVRAGGGIGDVIEAPDGDDYEVYRIIFDITFFFSVIIILLAIIQGLIIDAFGELRDQLLTVASDMESNCFICGIGKDVLDKVPRGFDTHVQKEHNLANYMFFLMHLINKPDTDYTGQETYVWELYQRRCWDFFPVGECFRTQSEEEADTKPAKD